MLLANFGAPSGVTCHEGDIAPPGGDGNVALDDLAAMLEAYGQTCP